MMNKNIKGITIVLDGDTTKLSKAMQSVVSESKKLHNELREVERALKFEPGNAELVAQKQEILRKNIELTKQRLDTLRQAHKQVEQQFKNNEISAEQFRAFRREVVLTESSLKTLKQKLGDIDGDNGVDRLKRKFNELGQSAKDAGQNIKDSIGNLSFAQTIASVVSLGAAVKTALDEDMLDTQIDIAFNVDDAGKQVVREAIGDIQAYGVEGQEALEGVRRQFALNADAADEANAKIVKSATAVTKVYAGLDFTELIQEINEVASELEITDEEALKLMNDLLSIGFPPEQIDIIAEYGQQLKRAGFEAEEIKNIIASATMTGSWNIDSLLDGLKEGRIRAAEMGNGLKKSMQDALRLELAKNPPDSKAYLDMEAKLVSWGKAIAKGGKEGSQAFIEMTEWLNGLEDATLKNTIGVELFGTRWEDEGDNIIQTILGVNDAQANLAKNAKDLTDSVSKLDETPMVKLQKATQDLVIALQPLLSVIADVVSAFAAFASENPKLLATILVVVGGLASLSAALAIMRPIISAVSGIFKKFSGSMDTLKGGIDKIKEAFGRLGTGLKATQASLSKIKNTFTSMKAPMQTTETSARKIDTTEKQLTTTTNVLKQSFDKLNATLKNLQGAIKGTTNDFKRLNTTMNAGKGTAAGMNQSATKLNNTTTKLNNNKKKLNTTMSGTNKILGSLSGSFTKAGTAAGNAGTKTSKLTSIFSKFSSLLSNVGKLLPIIARGFLSFSGPVGAAITAITSLISHFDLFKKIDLKKIGKAIIDGFLNGLKSAWNGVKSWIKDKANDVSKTFKDVLGIRSPSRVFASHGQDTMKGYQVGLESMKSTVIKDVTQTATSITSNFKNALSKSKLKDAIPRLSVDTIQKTTVEYRNSMQNNTQQSTYTNGLLESLLDKMSKINGGDGNHTATINLYLDGDIIGKANVDYINRRSKIEGRSVLKNLTF